MRSKKILSMLMALAMIITCLVTPSMASQTAPSTSGAAELTQSVSTSEGVTTVTGGEMNLNNEEVTIMVRLEGETTFMQTSDLQIAAANNGNQMATLAKAESKIEKALGESIEIKDSYSLLFNGFSFVGESWMIDAINEIDGVTAFADFEFDLIEAEVAETEEVNMTPSMSMSTNLTSTDMAWELGYTGEGMVVAVIDTGIRQTHEAFSVMPENGRMDVAYLRDVYAEYGEYMHGGSLQDLNDIYYNTKLPFNWDYFDGDAEPNHTASDHGTHVAGIAAGNNGNGFKGVAPDAQIVTMQVFTDAGGAAFSTLMLALEDCVYLGVDAINMSLGVTAYFTGYESIDSYLETIYDALEEAGVAVCAAAGNDTHTSNWTNFGDYFVSQYYWNVLNMDVGIIGAPSTFPGSFAVASVDNGTKSGGGYATAYGIDYYPVSSTSANTPAIGSLPAGEYDLVFAGNASPEELAAVGVEGKIVLAQRDAGSFTQKGINAYEAGAAGIIIYNNVPGSVRTSANVSIALGTLSLEDGEVLRNSLPDGVHGKITISNDFGYGSVIVSSFSSWGTTADLKIKPEISAPGGAITSSIGFGSDTSYATWSGTSMATPHIAGGVLLIKQALKEKMPDATAAEINNAAMAVMMSTAHQVAGFVRQQGAGLMDLEAGVSTDAYLTVDGGRPSIELDDSETGKFTFAIEVNNIGDTTKTYDVNFSAMTEAVSILAGYEGHRMVDHTWARKYSAGNFPMNPTTTDVKILSGAVKTVTSMVKLTGPKTVTVNAGETVTVNMTLTCTDELMDYFKENCPAGMYLEGFIKLNDQDENGTDLSAPFLGFVGDWDYAPMFDQGFWWQIPYGENNLSQMGTSNGTYVGYGMRRQGLGLNPYWDASDYDYLEDRNAISPNGDDYLDTVNYIEFSLMRNPKNVTAYVTDAEGNVVQYLLDATYTYRKEYYNPNMFSAGVGFSTITGEVYTGNMVENETYYVVVEAYLDHDEYVVEDNMNGRMVYPITVDLTAPLVAVVDGGIEIVDNQYTAYYAVYADAEKTQLIAENGVFADERGAAEFVEIADLDTYYVVTADYARNEGFYMVADGIVYDLGDTDILYGGRTVVGRQYFSGNMGYYNYAWTKYNSESSVKINRFYVPGEQNGMTIGGHGYDYVSGAIAADGTVYVNSYDDLYILNPETFEVTHVATFVDPNGNVAGGYNLMTNPETYEMYCYGWIKGMGGNVICKLDVETGLLTPLWQITNIPGANQIASCHWAACFLDGDTVAVFGSYGDIGFYNLETGAAEGFMDMQTTSPLYGISNLGINGVRGSMLYNEENNSLYIFSNWQWLENHNPFYQGHVVFDLDTGIPTYVHSADGTYSIHGLYWEDAVKPADFYVVVDLINAIGEVTLDSGDAIKAAREAYDALSEKDQALVENYETLLKAERDYLFLVSETALLETAKNRALLGINELEKTYGESEIFEAAKAAIIAAETIDEVNAIMDELAVAIKVSAFNDVKTNEWFYNSILYVVGNGYMEGMSENTFAPNAAMTRAQLVTVLYRVAGEPSIQDGMVNPFADVAADAWYADAVIWAYNVGIVNGKSETVFAPNAALTREELVTILYRADGEAEANVAVLAGYEDLADVADYAVGAFAWAVENGIVNGMTDTTLAPQGNATRAQVATILMRYVG